YFQEILSYRVCRRYAAGPRGAGHSRCRQKVVIDIAKEMGDLAKLAREGKLKPDQMQGGTFTISSLGGIGGTYFTPIINAPEVAIMGACRSFHKMVWDGGAGSAAPHSAALAVVGPSRDRRCGGCALQRLFRKPPCRHAACSRVGAENNGGHRSKSAGHRRLQGPADHRRASPPRRSGENRGFADHT